MSRARQLEDEVAAFHGEVNVKQAGRILRALDSFARYEHRHDYATAWTAEGPVPLQPAERNEMQAGRRKIRRWLRSVVKSAAFQRCYAALPADKRIAHAHELTRSLGVLWGIVRDHQAGRLQPSAFLHSRDHEANLKALRKLAPRFPGGPREWILETAERIERYLARSDFGSTDIRDEIAPRDLIGTRGGASADDAGAFTGWLVRSVAAFVPDATEQRAAAISDLLDLCGLKTSSGNVRSILVAWSSKRR